MSLGKFNIRGGAYFDTDAEIVRLTRIEAAARDAAVGLVSGAMDRDFEILGGTAMRAGFMSRLAAGSDAGMRPAEA